MYIDDKLIEWVKATDDIHTDFVKKNFMMRYYQLILKLKKKF